MKKANRTGKYNEPPVIEDLGDGTFYYNFDVRRNFINTNNSPKVEIDWKYNQVRLPYPVDEALIQSEINKQNYKHEVNLE